MAENAQHPDPDRRRGLRKTAARAGALAFFTIRVLKALRYILRRAGEVLLALVIIFEEWGWQPLAAALASLARLRPVAAIEMMIVGLPPYAALAVFALPTLLLLPLKLAALWLIATGHVIAATLLFVGAKLAGTALIARLFQLTQPRLMQLEWFAAIYNRVMPWKHALVEQVKASPVWRTSTAFVAGLKARAKIAIANLRPRLQPLVARVRELLRGR